MPVKTRIGELYVEKNKNTGEEFLYDNLGRETVYTYSSNAKSQYQIYIHGLNEISRDKRKSSIHIVHILNNDTKHEINIVADFGHSYKNQKGLHLNLTNDSKKEILKCKECMKYFWQFNHKEVIPEKMDTLNLIDADSIWSQIHKILSQSLVSDYKFHDSTNLLFNPKS